MESHNLLASVSSSSLSSFRDHIRPLLVDPRDHFNLTDELLDVHSYAGQLGDQMVLAKAYLVIAKENNNLLLAWDFTAQIRASQLLLSKAATRGTPIKSGQDSKNAVKFRNPKYLSMLNHLRFYIPEIHPQLEKVVFLDDDVMVQKDLTPLFSVDLHGNVNGAVETCLESFHRYHKYLNFSHPQIRSHIDYGWAFGMNIFDLVACRKANVTIRYHYWQEQNVDRTLWKLGNKHMALLKASRNCRAQKKREGLPKENGQPRPSQPLSKQGGGDAAFDQQEQVLLGPIVFSSFSATLATTQHLTKCTRGKKEPLFYSRNSCLLQQLHSEEVATT